MNDPLQPLHLLLEQAEAERNAALAALNRSRERCRLAEQQALQLDAYRCTYRERWSLQFAQGAALAIVHCHHAFADRLDTAIAQQAEASRLAEAGRQQATHVLETQELRVASVRKLIERRAQTLRHQHERRDQKASDEEAMRMHLRRNHEATARPSALRP